jgi:hypothetical protein
MANQPDKNAKQNIRDNYNQKRPTLGLRDGWEFVIKIIIAVLVILWFFRNFLNGREQNWIAWLIFILILIFIIWLILRQRHFIYLHCALTSPDGCTEGHTDIIAGRRLEPVLGSAYGLGFSHYIIEVRDPGANLLSNVVIYANGGGSPDLSLIQGSFAKVSTTLGWIDVEKAAMDAGILLLSSTTFNVKLRVFGVDGSEKLPNCETNFSIEVNEVFIKQAGAASSNVYTDPNEPLKTGGPASPLSTIGGGISVRGSANIYGCTDEKIAEYSVWMIKDDKFTFVQPATNTSVVPNPATWILVANIKFNGGTGFTPDQERGYNPLTGDPIPNFLTNTWGTRTECITFFGSTFCWTVPTLNPFYYNTGALPKLYPVHEGNGTGKFTILLQVIDTDGNRYYDIQRAWVDNEPIHAAITGIAGLSPCTDLFTKNAAGFKTVQITGTAWDQLIDLGDGTAANPIDLTKPTSDNFNEYLVYFNKQGAASGWQLLKSSTDPVPARPNPVGVGVLSDWKLQTIDKATNPDNRPADQLLDPGESCSYDILLGVNDKTIVSESTNHNSGWITFPIKIVNATP